MHRRQARTRRRTSRRSTRSMPVTSRPRACEHVREQQPDRAEPDHRRAPAVHVAEPVELRPAPCQRLDDRRLDVGQLVVEPMRGVDARDVVLGQPVVPLRPADDAGAAREVTVDDLTDHFVQRVARRAVAVDEGVAGAVEARHVRPADAAGVQPHEHPSGGRRRRGRLDALELPRPGDRIRPHVGRENSSTRWHVLRAMLALDAGLLDRLGAPSPLVGRTVLTVSSSCLSAVEAFLSRFGVTLACEDVDPGRRSATRGRSGRTTAPGAR